MSNGETNQINRNKSRTIFYVLLLLILFGINIYLYIKFNQRSNEAQKLTQLVITDSSRLNDLNMKYQEALVTIESYKGQNAQLDSIIAIKEKALMDLKNSYASQVKKNKMSKEEYDRQVADLNNIVLDLQNQIAVLQQQNKVLITKNDSIGQSLALQISTNTDLQNKNAMLSKKVNIASLLKPDNFIVVGTRTKSSGKEDETTTAKKVTKLKICWTVPANEVADAGQKTFYVRVISPEGTTLAAESAGSGIFKDAKDGSPVQYSLQNVISYDQAEQNTCSYWAQSAPFSKGNYTVNIYQDGYLVGSQKLALK